MVFIQSSVNHEGGGHASVSPLQEGETHRGTISQLGAEVSQWDLGVVGGQSKGSRSPAQGEVMGGGALPGGGSQSEFLATYSDASACVCARVCLRVHRPLLLLLSPRSCPSHFLTSVSALTGGLRDTACSEECGSEPRKQVHGPLSERLTPPPEPPQLGRMGSEEERLEPGLTAGLSRLYAAA